MTNEHDKLGVYFEGRPVGTVAVDGSGRFTFEYAPSWVSDTNALPTVPALTVIWHPHLDRIGQIAPLTNLLEFDVAHVSRSEPIFFPPGADAGEPLAHSFVSKSPVLDVVFTGGTFELRRVQEYQVDVDGQPLENPRRVGAADLQRGLIITLAKRIVLCLHSVRFPISRSPALGLLGASDAIEDVRRAVTRLAAQDSPVLLRGESGSGKELAARALHSAGPRAKHRFVPVNMNTLGGERAAADLFGHKKGAFTGATADSPGYFRAAAGGTIFLDEIGYTTAMSNRNFFEFSRTASSSPSATPRRSRSTRESSPPQMLSSSKPSLKNASSGPSTLG